MQKTEFFDQLNTCLSADRPRLIGRWQRLRTTAIDKLDAARIDLKKALEKSQIQVLARQERLPAVLLNEELPVSARAEDIVKAIQQHQVVVIAGETGSGKTTQLPKLCLLAGRGRTGVIGHTQPRRLAARSVAARIAEELQTALGDVVGFKVRFSEAVNDNSYIKLMTDGILLAELAHDRLLNAYDTLIIDEAHERSLNIDFLLGYIKQILPKRPDLKVIITSATLDIERFSQHFTQAPVLTVEGRTYPVELRYRPILSEQATSDEDEGFDDLEEALPRAVLAAVDECLEHARQQGRTGQGDILIFASTEREIRQLADTLRKYGPAHTEVLPLYARLSLNEQQKIFHPTGKGRRIVIATNVAETSLTVPNIYYVIDPGFARISRYSYRSRVQRLPIEAVSQAAANQRKGRCGRIAAGVCIRLYGEEDFLSRPLYTEPEIRRTHLAAVILQMQALGLGTIENFPFIEPPDGRYINDGFRVLEELGAVDAERNLTNLGQQLSRFPLDPRLARIIIAGAHQGCLDEILIIVSALSVQDPRERPPEKQQQADQKHALFREADSDFLFFVKLWRTLEEIRGDLSENQRKQWAKTHFLSPLRLREWRETHHQLLLLCKEFDLHRNEEHADYETVHRALLTGFLAQIAQKNDEREFLAARNQKAKIFPASVIYKKSPPWVMASELVETAQVWLRTVAKIEPIWIEQVGKHLLKHHVYEPHWEKKAGRVMAYEQLSLFGLIVNPRHKIAYEPVNLVDARQIFIRDALVTGDINLNAPFLRHNRQLIDDIVRVEDKVRRRDLLVDEEALFAFYDQRIPNHVANARSLDSWRREQEKTQPECLFLKPDDLLARDQLPVIDAYPEQISLQGFELALSYHFDPSTDEDGVTLRIPVPVLAQLNEAALSWLIAGWLPDKVEALLKGLPKTLRRQLVPVPDTVKQVMAQLTPPPTSTKVVQSLTAAISTILWQKGIRITTEDWREAEAQLPDYCRFYLRVVDEQGRSLASGRDLERLQIQFAHQQVAVIPDSSTLLVAMPEVIEPILTKVVAGVPTKHYAALVLSEQNAGLTLQYLSQEAEAAKQHQVGLLWLLQRQCPNEIKQLKKYLIPQVFLDFVAFGSKSRLEHLFVDAVFRAVFSDNVVYSQSDFKELLDKKRRALLQDGHKLAETVAQIYRAWQEVTRQLALLKQPIFKASVADIEQQLQHLQPENFLANIAYPRWREYPRYLKGLSTRLERLPNNLTRDSAATVDMTQRWRAYEQKRSTSRQPEVFEDYRWLLEEYRLSLFAQPMKTAQPVSAERLNRLLATL